MNYFIYNAADGCLWLEMPYIPESSFQNRYDAANYHRSYNSRLRYECSDELKAILKDGQRVGDDEFALDYRGVNKMDSKDMPIAIPTLRLKRIWPKVAKQSAIPKPEQKEERRFSLEDENIRKEILRVLHDCMYDFDYGYSKEVGTLNIRMVDRNKASYGLLELFKKFIDLNK